MTRPKLPLWYDYSDNACYKFFSSIDSHHLVKTFLRQTRDVCTIYLLVIHDLFPDSANVSYTYEPRHDISIKWFSTNCRAPVSGDFIIGTLLSYLFISSCFDYLKC